MTQPQATVSRARLLAFVHRQSALLKLAPKSEDYRAWLKRRTGQESCRDLSDAELAKLAASLKATRQQWQRLYRLVILNGFTGMEDENFLRFMTRITKERNRLHLSRVQMSHLLIALKKWLNYKTRKVAGGGEASSAEAPARMARPDTTGGTGGPAANEKVLADDTCQDSTPVSRSRILEPSPEAFGALPR